MPALFLIFLWLILGAIQDWRYRKVSHLLVYSGLAFGLLLRIVDGGVGTWADVFVILILLSIGWWCKWIGGADAKATLAIALVSVPWAVWAWVGACACFALLKIVKPQQYRRFPGFVGFAAGIAANLAFVLIGG